MGERNRLLPPQPVQGASKMMVTKMQKKPGNEGDGRAVEVHLQLC